MTKIKMQRNEKYMFVVFFAFKTKINSTFLYNALISEVKQ